MKDWLYDTYVAHRGIYDNDAGVIENTMPAFRKAVEMGYNIELDVQLTKDGQLITYHDDNLKRIFGIDKFVDEFTFDELQSLRFLQSETARIPLFSEVCELCAGKVGIMIEIKKKASNELDHKVEDELLKVLKPFEGKLDFIVKSFNPFSVDYMRVKAPSYRRGFLSYANSLDDYKDYQQPMVERLLFDKDRKVEFFDFLIKKPESQLLKTMIGKMPIIFWTVDSQETYDLAMKLGNNIIFEHFNPPARKK